MSPKKHIEIFQYGHRELYTLICYFIFPLKKKIDKKTLPGKSLWEKEVLKTQKDIEAYQYDLRKFIYFFEE